MGQKAAALGTIRDEGVKHIGNGAKTSVFVNIVIGKLARIAAAVKIFMMLISDMSGENR